MKVADINDSFPHERVGKGFRNGGTQRPHRIVTIFGFGFIEQFSGQLVQLMTCTGPGHDEQGASLSKPAATVKVDPSRVNLSELFQILISSDFDVGIAESHLFMVRNFRTRAFELPYGQVMNVKHFKRLQVFLD
ncbi:MAG: hypothetical protein QM703_29050 [Gemmatales bacterium]